MFELKINKDDVLGSPYGRSDISFNMVKSNRTVENNIENEVNRIQSALKKFPKKIDYEQSNKIVIDTVEYIKYTCNLCLNPSEKEFYDIFEIGKNLLTRTLDITKYLKMSTQINHLMNLLLKPYQIFLINNQKKINLLCPEERLNYDIPENDDLSSENEIHINLIDTIMKKLKESSLENIDSMLYNHLDSYYKKFIDDLLDPIKNNEL